ncbi:MAG TPA: hypothetical protein VMU27_03660 [Candidatus Paceibacterota bacterium]|nr:hypothetical protein [Candidatus Paceibacterota bacterium]
MSTKTPQGSSTSNKYSGRSKTSFIWLTSYFQPADLEKYEPKDILLLAHIVRRIERDGRVRVSRMFESHGARFQNRDTLRGYMRRFVENGFLFSLTIRDQKEGSASHYFVNSSEFYEPERLVKLLPREEVDRIATHVGDEELSIRTLTQRIYGDRPSPPIFIVETVLNRFVKDGLMTNKGGRYKLTDRGREFGVDSETLAFLDNTRLENIATAEKEGEKADPIQLTREKLLRLHEEDLREKRIKSADLRESLAGRANWTLLPICEVLFGNQATDVALLNFVIETSRPDVTITSGLVQGSFAAEHKKKQFVLTHRGGLHRVSHQTVAAGVLLSDLEKITKDLVCYSAGDDDVATAEDFAKLAQLAEGKSWQFGVAATTLSGELAQRLHFREWMAKRAIQLTVIQPYQFRIGRGLMNRREVESLIGIRKSEYRLIIEILAYVKLNGDWPDTITAGRWWPSSYERVVNIAALRGDLEGKRLVTPDSLSLIVPGSLRHDGKGAKSREILFVHNTNFSRITQYVDPLYALEKSVRQRLAAGHDVPFMTMDGQQEKFYLCYIGGEPHSGGHWAMTLPGMQHPLQEAEFKMDVAHRGALTSKSHRQATFRKMLTVPGAPEFRFFDDGRVRVRILDNKMRQVLKNQEGQPEVCKTIALVQDLQTGSITMCPEVAIKAQDYAYYQRGAHYTIWNGDIIQGTNYPQHFSESQSTRLVGMHNQKRFVLKAYMPLIEDAPNLERVVTMLGNHEWNSKGRNLSGSNDLEYLESRIQGLIDGRRQASTPSPLREVINVFMMRIARLSGPTSANVVAHPYYTCEVGGFKLAFAHLWRLFGGAGRTPVDKQRAWLTGMANVAGDIDVMVGGHYHSLWMCQEAGTLCVSAPAAASQSGYELMLALAPETMMTVIEVSNRTGVTFEFIPWEFLLDHYKCQSPFYRGRDEELLRPQPGTVEYRHGRMSPLVEHLIDEVNTPIEHPM